MVRDASPGGGTLGPGVDRAELEADGTPPPRATHSGVDQRVLDAWCTWLGELATNSEAALAAALAYEQLDAAARDRWLTALEHDAPRAGVPPIAAYAPLLAVETDVDRRSRILEAVGPPDRDATPTGRPRALRGAQDDGVRVATLVTPLYLDFVQVLVCGYRPFEGFLWVKHDPIVEASCAPQHGDDLSGVTLESTPFQPLLDELAHVVVQHGRSGRNLPDALSIFADYFGPALETSSPA